MLLYCKELCSLFPATERSNKKLQSASISIPVYLRNQLFKMAFKTLRRVLKARKNSRRSSQPNSQSSSQPTLSDTTLRSWFPGPVAVEVAKTTKLPTAEGCPPWERPGLIGLEESDETIPSITLIKSTERIDFSERTTAGELDGVKFLIHSWEQSRFNSQ